MTCHGSIAALVLALLGCGAISEDEAARTSDEITSGGVQITRAETGELRIKSDLPARVSDCSGARCADVDRDGLVDAWEDMILERLHPAVTFDEDEPLLKGDHRDDVFTTLGRVTMGANGHVTVNVLLLYTKDYGAPNPICFSASQHAGDVERVALDLELLADGTAVTRAMFTTGHEGTEDDQSRVWRGADLKTLEVIEDPNTGLLRWRVYASQGKHATYATKKHCEAVRLKSLTHRFCVNEDCAPDRVPHSDEVRFTRVAKIANAGEPDARRVDDLAGLGFRGESAWSGATFCGGLAVDRTKEECPPPVRDKLLADPFAQ